MKRSGLKPPTLAEVQAWQARPRKPIGRNAAPARVGRKAKREEAAWSACRAAVIERSGGYCEAKNMTVPGSSPPWEHGATDVHHIWPEDRDQGRHDPARCLHVCRGCHAAIHEHPAWAKELGLFRPDPAPVAQTPIWPEE